MDELIEPHEEAPAEWDGEWRLLKRNRDTGISEWFLYDHLQGTVTIRMTQDVEPILDNNRALANHDDGWSKDKEMRRIASIPMTLVQQFRNQGFNILQPEKDLTMFKRIMNDSDFSKLRTADWRV